MEKHLKKAKTWNMVVIVLELLSLIMGVVGLPNTLNPKLSDYKMMGDSGQQMFAYMDSPLTKAIAVLSVVVSVVLLFFYFKANKKLAEGLLPTKVPYYVTIGWSILGSVIGFIMQPKMQVEGMNITFVATIVGVVFQIIFLIPAILVIVHLFKAEPEE